jgi:transposase-like protein
MDHEIRQRLTWVTLYEQNGSAGLVCRRCGISRPTLRKWWRRYQAEGVAGKYGTNRQATDVRAVDALEKYFKKRSTVRAGLRGAAVLV